MYAPGASANSCWKASHAARLPSPRCSTPRSRGGSQAIDPLASAQRGGVRCPTATRRRGRTPLPRQARSRVRRWPRRGVAGGRHQGAARTAGGALKREGAPSRTRDRPLPGRACGDSRHRRRPESRGHPCGEHGTRHGGYAAAIHSVAESLAQARCSAACPSSLASIATRAGSGPDGLSRELAHPAGQTGSRRG